MNRTTLIALCTLFYPACGTMGYSIGPWEIRQCGPTFYTYDQDTDPMQREQIRAAFGYVNGVLQRQLWVDAGATDAEEVPASDAITRVKFVPSFEGNICGITKLDWRASGCIVNVVIRMSVECENASTVAAWQTKLRHEVVHASGLINHNEDPAGLMYFSSPNIGDTPKKLSEDEMDALVSLYP